MAQVAGQEALIEPFHLPPSSRLPWGCSLADVFYALACEVGGGLCRQELWPIIRGDRPHQALTGNELVQKLIIGPDVTHGLDLRPLRMQVVEDNQKTLVVRNISEFATSLSCTCSHGLVSQFRGCSGGGTGDLFFLLIRHGLQVRTISSSSQSMSGHLSRSRQCCFILIN